MRTFWFWFVYLPGIPGGYFLTFLARCVFHILNRIKGYEEDFWDQNLDDISLLLCFLSGLVFWASVAGSIIWLVTRYNIILIPK